MTRIPRLKASYRQQKETGKHQIYLYDDIKERGEFNWKTWECNPSKTSAEFIRQLLEDIPEDGEIELFINSNGGSVKEGTSIYNQLKRHKAKKTGYVDGVAHSIAFVILQACDHRIMGEGTSALVHEMWVCCCGNAEQLRKEADQLDVLMKSNRKLFLQKSKNLTEEELIEMMKSERILTPDEALHYGFCDEIVGRKEDVPDLGGARQSLREIKEEFQKKSNFEKEINAFKESVEKEQPEEPSEPNQENQRMNAFFNAFL